MVLIFWILPDDPGGITCMYMTRKKKNLDPMKTGDETIIATLFFRPNIQTEYTVSVFISSIPNDFILLEMV